MSLGVFLGLSMTGRHFGVQGQEDLPHSLKQRKRGDLRDGSEQLIPRGSKRRYCTGYLALSGSEGVSWSTVHCPPTPSPLSCHR